MTPTLPGRLQTRLLLAVLVGLPVAVLFGLLPGGVTVGGALSALTVLTALGLGWECVYHLIQQQRWDGDWPSSVALGVGVIEALVVYPVLGLVGAAPRFGALMALLAVVGVAQWAAAQGPVSVFLPQWRHRGHRVIGPRSATPARPPRTAPAIVLPRLPRLPRFPQLRLTRQQLVIAGGVAAMALAVLLLAPLVGSRSHPSMPAAMAHKASGAPHAPASMADIRRTTWDTTHRISPRSLRFPAAGVDVVLDRVRMTSSGSLGTPQPGRAAWFAQGAAPGQRGPAVVIGDSADVFARLGQVREGQRFTVTRSDRSTVRFVVDDVVRVDAARFPTRRVYGPSLRPRARLIGFDRTTGRNVIVFAHAVAVTTPAVRS